MMPENVRGSNVDNYQDSLNKFYVNIAIRAFFLLKLKNFVYMQNSPYSDVLGGGNGDYMRG